MPQGQDFTVDRFESVDGFLEDQLHFGPLHGLGHRRESAEQLRGEGESYGSEWPTRRYAHAEMLFLLGRHEEAERWFLSDEPFVSGEQYMAPRFRRLAQIAERRGDQKKATEYYDRFVELWSDCDPDLRPQVDEAKARLAALRGG